MTIEALKKSIQDKTIQPSCIIFKISEDDFIPMQYAKECSKIWNKKIIYINNIDRYCTAKLSIFDNDETSKDLEIYKVDELNVNFTSIPDSMFIITKKISKEIESKYKDIIVEIPKLENWQLQYYTYGQLKIDEKAADWLTAICNYNPYNLSNEIEKYSQFSEAEQKIIFRNVVDEGSYEQYTSLNIWDLSNAIISRNLNKVLEVYKKIKYIDVEPIGLVTVLLNNFRKVINIQLTQNATPENTGIPTKQFYAIRNNCGKYSGKELIKIYKFLLDIDKKIKTGYVDTKILIDYVLTFILSSNSSFSK